MTPNEMNSIIMGLLKSSEEWKKNYSGDEKTKVDKAYAAGAMEVLGTFGSLCGEQLEAESEEENPGSENEMNLENYLYRSIIRFSENFRCQYVQKAFFENYKDAFGLLMEMFRGYTNNPNLKEDEDDGITGEESEARHWIFDGVIGSLPLINAKTVSKDGVVRALRSCADYIESLK